MNRHFQAYNALPCEPLGTPIRKQEEKKSPETPWKPIPGHPDYRERINAQGVREVSHKDNVPPPVVGLTQAESEARGDVTTLAPSAQTEWQSGPPPSVAQSVIWRGKGVHHLWAKVVAGRVVHSTDGGKTWGEDDDGQDNPEAYLRQYFVPLEPQQ